MRGAVENKHMSDDEVGGDESLPNASLAIGNTPRRGRGRGARVAKSVVGNQKRVRDETPSRHGERRLAASPSAPGVGEGQAEAAIDETIALATHC